LIAVDASAILSMLLDEPEAPPFRNLLRERGGCITPINHWEVLSRAFVVLGPSGPAEAEALMEAYGVAVAPISAQHSRVAARAFRQFGKRSAAGLSLGDCFAYALAEIEGDGLLFKGDDFPRTDVTSALA
jgi:ribonuclease VapC